MIGKGHYEKGAVWVAMRVPDGHVSGHANQARIQRFPLHKADECVYSSDVEGLAVLRRVFLRGLVGAEFCERK